MIKYFKSSEFICNGVNCYDLVNKESLSKLDNARELANTPFKINSSWRDEYTNLDAGGKPNSAHLRGKAFDISCTTSNKRLKIVKALLDAGFTRIGIAKTFIHADDDTELPQQVMWLY